MDNEVKTGSMYGWVGMLLFFFLGDKGYSLGGPPPPCNGDYKGQYILGSSSISIIPLLQGGGVLSCSMLRSILGFPIFREATYHIPFCLVFNPNIIGSMHLDVLGLYISLHVYQGYVGIRGE